MNELATLANQYIQYNNTTRIFSAIIIFLFFLFLRKVFAKYILKLLLKISKKTATELDDNLFLSFKRPLMGMIIILGAFLAIKILPISFDIQVTALVITRAVVIVLIAWGFYGFLDSSSFLFNGIQQRVGIELDKAILPFISKILKLVVVALAGVLVISEFGYDISGFIAGLGLGGLAFALAAQDTASNIFGGIVILLDRPFSVGDWIMTPSVEGVIEDISLRSTRVRTFAQSIVVMPNSTLVNEPITNWTRMTKRRIKFIVGVTYNTSKAKLEKCVEKIRDMLTNHPDINKELIIVRFDSFNASSLDIFIYCFTNTTQWEEFLRVKEDVNFRIMELLEQENVSFAFPSRSIYIEEMPKEK